MFDVYGPIAVDPLRGWVAIKGTDVDRRFVVILDARTGDVLHEHDLSSVRGVREAEVRALLWHRNGWLAAAMDNRVVHLNWRHGQVRQYACTQGEIHDLAWWDGGRALLVGSWDGLSVQPLLAEECRPLPGWD